MAGSQGCALLPLALVAFRLPGWTGGGGGGGLLPLDLRGSGVGTVPFRPFSDGCLSLHWQAWGDRGPEPWVAVVLLFGYCLPFLGSPPFFQCSAPYTFLQPHFHLGCCSGGVHHGPHCHGCSGACSFPFSRVFYSHLFAMWLSSRSWRPVMTLSHLLCFCDSVSISDGAHSVCAPVSMSGDWMAYLVLRAAFSSGAGPSCFSSPSALPLLRHCLSIQGSLLCPPMAPLVFTWVLAPVSAFLPTLLLRMRR